MTQSLKSKVGLYASMGPRVTIVEVENLTPEQFDKLSSEQMRDYAKMLYKVRKSVTDLDKKELEEIDRLHPDALRAYVRSQKIHLAESTMRFQLDEASVESQVRAFGTMEEALRRYIKACLLLRIQVESQSFGTPSNDWPPVLVNIQDLTQKKWDHAIPLEARMEQIIDERVRAELQQVLSAKEDILRNARNIAFYNTQITTLKERVMKSSATVQERDTTIGQLQEARRNLDTKVQSYSTAVDTAQAQILTLQNKYTADEKIWKKTASDLQIANHRVEGQEKQIETIRQQTEEARVNYKKELDKAGAEIAKNVKAIQEVKGLLDGAQAANDELAEKVGTLEVIITTKDEMNERLARESKTHLDYYHEADNRAKINQTALEQTQERLENTEDVLKITKKNLGDEQRSAASLNEALDVAKEQLREEKSQHVKDVDSLNTKIKVAKAGRWTYRLGLAGVSLALAGVLYFYRPSVEPGVEKPVPVETIGYTGKDATVQFGDEVYKMTLKDMSEIYGYIEQDQKRLKRPSTPADRKKYFDDRKDKTYRIKGK